MVAPTLISLPKNTREDAGRQSKHRREIPQWAMQYGVQGIPTMLFIANGKIVHRQVGALPEPMLRTVLGQFLEVATPVN